MQVFFDVIGKEKTFHSKYLELLAVSHTTTPEISFEYKSNIRTEPGIP